MPWPSRSRILGAINRDIVSSESPGGNGTMMRIDLVGNGWPCTIEPNAGKTARTSKDSRRFMTDSERMVMSFCHDRVTLPRQAYNPRHAIATPRHASDCDGCDRRVRTAWLRTTVSEQADPISHPFAS